MVLYGVVGIWSLSIAVIGLGIVVETGRLNDLGPVAVFALVAVVCFGFVKVIYDDNQRQARNRYRM